MLTISIQSVFPDRTLNNVNEVRSRGALLIGFSSVEIGEKYLDTVVDISELGILEPLVANAGMTQFAYYVADRRWWAIDKPRNLAKRVTVE